jgi:tripartite-type tricarboxylate transporter receptor subunit TctC
VGERQYPAQQNLEETCVCCLSASSALHLLLRLVTAAAQEWPNRPVTMIVPFPAGAAVDTLARAVANALSENLGKQFIVDNRAGAGGNLGGTAVAKAAADGYTLLFGTPAPIAMNKLMYKGLAYDSERDFTPVVLVAKSPLIIAAKLDFPAKTLPS